MHDPPSRTPAKPMQISLRTILLALLTCAVAFAVLFGWLEFYSPVRLLALAVPIFWFGLALLVGADALYFAERRRIGTAVFVVGLWLIVGSIFLAICGLVAIVAWIGYSPW